MPILQTAKEPFRFFTRLHLSELTGLRAQNIEELLALVKQVSDSCIYHHTHRFLLQHQFLSPEPPNDFAYWVNGILGEGELGEELASIDIMQFSTIQDLRLEIIGVLESYLNTSRSAKLKFARQGEEFHFIKSISFVVPTPYIAYNLSDFMEIMGKITIDSIYYHMFEARLRLGKKINDFSNWIEMSLDEKDLAGALARLDLYTRTLEDLRETIIATIGRRLKDGKT